MSVEALSAFIAEYIAGRRQTKLEAFDKKAASRSVEDSATIAAERRELERRFEPEVWLTDAAKRAWQNFLPVTHAAKYSHGENKGSSYRINTNVIEGYFNTSAVDELTLDVVKNAAVFDLAILFLTNIEGTSLLSFLQQKDARPFSCFTNEPILLALWIEGFSKALNEDLSLHKYAKQNYFPVGDGYHLLSPLFATSLVHAMHQKLIAFRFGDDVKAIWKARREKSWHPGTLTLFPDSAEIHFGGTKPQNISYLNSVRGGRSWLLSCQPPQWKKAEKPPTTLRSIFTSGGQFDRRANSTVQLLVSLLTRTGDYTNVRIREARDEYIDALIDLLFVVASELQRDTWQNWTISCPRLASHQQLWLDPWRTKNDEVFRLERDKDDWQAGVAEDFALWLNTRLRKGLKDIGKVEEREWQTREHLRTNLREMEKIIQGALK